MRGIAISSLAPVQFLVSISFACLCSATATSTRLVWLVVVENLSSLDSAVDPILVVVIFS
jgi:hypothetical protein